MSINSSFAWALPYHNKRKAGFMDYVLRKTGFFSRIIFLVLLLIFNLILLTTYKNVFAELFFYQKYYYYSKPEPELIFVFFLALFPALLLPIKFRNLSSLILLFLYVVVYCPSIIIGYISSPGSVSDDLHYYFMLPGCMLLLILSMQFAENHIFSKTGFYEKRVSNLFFNGLTFIHALILIYLYLNYQIGDIWELFTFNVYDTRLQAREVSLGFSGYLIRFASNVSAPILLVYGLVYRNLIFTAIGFLSNLLIFLLEGSKGVLFMPFFLTFIFYVIRKDFNFNFLLLFLLLLLVGSLFLDDRFHTAFSSYIIRRTFIVPGLLTKVYHDVFSTEPTYQWTYNIFRFFQPPLMDISPPYFVGYFYFGYADMSANANPWADGFANSYTLGPLIETIITLVFLILADYMGFGNRIFVACALFASYYSIISSSIFTSLLTHGMIICLLVVALLLRKPQPADVSMKVD